jgi:hypothetical protein
MYRNRTNGQTPIVEYAAALIVMLILSLQGCGDGLGGGPAAPTGNQGALKTGTFRETWESSDLKTYKPGTDLTLIGGDEGEWLLDATVNGDSDCGETPHRAEVIDEGGSKKIKLVANNSRSGCADNIWLAWDPRVNGNPKQIKMTPNTHISFKMSAKLFGQPSTTGWFNDNCGLGLPCGVSLAVVDNHGNAVFYRFEWPLDAEEDTDITYTKILMADEFRGVFARNLYDDFSQIPNFNPSDSYVTAINFEIMPWDDSESELGWAMIDDLVIDDHAVVLAALTDIDRVPIYNPNKPNRRSVRVALSPSPLPNGDFVTLDLSTLFRTGAATFDDGTTTKQIRETTTLNIIGVENSTGKDNIKLSVKWRGAELAEDRFSVRTWPENFQKLACGHSLPNDGTLVVTNTWESESGNLADLNGNIIGEWVSYPWGAGDFPPSPPYKQLHIPNPTILDNSIPNELDKPDQLIDFHRNLTGFRTPYEANIFTATQYYFFRDPVLMSERFDWNDEASYTILSGMGPFSITREVYQDSAGIWKYRIEKDGCSNEIVMP